MLINVNIFALYEFLLQNVIKFHRQFTKIKRKFWEQVASFEFHYKER